MSTLAVELSDAGILAGSDPAGSTRIAASPGYALIDGATLLTGADALARARLKPRHVDNRFWSALDTTPLAGPFGTELTRADLAHAHLAAVWRDAGADAERVILALPGTATERQLGLILGIARACGMPVAGMVDAAVAAAVAESPEGNLLHVDLQLHRAVVTELSRGREVVRRQARVGDRLGIVAFNDLCVRWIAQQFVRRTRFDPLQAAATEQALHGALPRLLEELRDAESTPAEVEAGSTVHSIELRRESLLAAVEPIYEGILQLVGLLKRAGETATVLLTHRADGLPGLRSRLTEIGDADLLTLAPEAAIVGALGRRQVIRSDAAALPFVTRLPVGAGSGKAVGRRSDPVVARATRRRPGRPPTHLLDGELAHPIQPEPLCLGVAPPAGERGIRLAGNTAGISRSHCSVYAEGDRVVIEDSSTHGSFVNGQRVGGKTELVAGDRLRMGTPGIELRLIRVAEEDGQ